MSIVRHLAQSSAAVCLLIAYLIMPAAAGTIIDTGPGQSSRTGFIVKGQNYQAGEFTTSAISIDRIEGWFTAQYVTSRREIVNVKLYTDGGDVPGIVLYSKTFTVDPTVIGWQGVDGVKWVIPTGTYWFAFEGTSGNDGIFAALLPDGAPAPLTKTAYVSQSTNGAYVAATRTATFGVRIYGETDVNSVPEPSIWLFMIAGFGGIACMMRYRATACDAGGLIARRMRRTGIGRPFVALSRSA